MDAGCAVVRQYHGDKVGSQISSKIEKASEKNELEVIISPRLFSGKWPRRDLLGLFNFHSLTKGDCMLMP